MVRGLIPPRGARKIRLVAIIPDVFYSRVMNSSKFSTGIFCVRRHWTGANLAYHVLRLWLGVRALVTGIEKFAATRIVEQPLVDPVTGMEDPSGALVQVAQKYYALTNNAGVVPSLKTKLLSEPLLPHGMTQAMIDAIGPSLIALGLMTLTGLGARLALTVQALLYIALTVGLILLHEDSGIAWLGLHLGLIALALWLGDVRRESPVSVSSDKVAAS